MQQKYVIGTGPFCGGEPSDCDMPGFVPGGKVDKGCWTGSKQECKFDLDTYKKTGLYNEVLNEKGKEFADSNIPAKFHVRGTAPFCGGTVCDLVNAGYYPVGTSKNGMESTCASGFKAVGVERKFCCKRSVCRLPIQKDRCYEGAMQARPGDGG